MTQLIGVEDIAALKGSIVISYLIYFVVGILAGMVGGLLRAGGCGRHREAMPGNPFGD